MTAAPGVRLDRDLVVFLTVLLWVPVVLGLDTDVTRAGQPALGGATWLLLLVLLRREDTLTRLQVGVVIAFASLVEYTFSAGLHVYVYRLGGVPTFVPPGHGLIYLAALALGRSTLLHRHGRAAVTTTLVSAAIYGLWGLSPLAPRLDVLGAFWAGCLALFLLKGRSPLTFVGAFVLVSWLEIVGTRLGSWTWAAHSPTGWVAQGNPPTGAAGGYGFFDAAALFAAPWLERALARLTRTPARHQRLRSMTPKRRAGAGRGLLDRVADAVPTVRAGAGVGHVDLGEARPTAGLDGGYDAPERDVDGVVAIAARGAGGPATVGVHGAHTAG